MLNLLLLALFGSKCGCCKDDEHFLDGCCDMDCPNQNENGNLCTPMERFFQPKIVDVYNVSTFYSTVAGGQSGTQAPLYVIRLYELEDPSLPIQYAKVVIRNVPNG